MPTRKKSKATPMRFSAGKRQTPATRPADEVAGTIMSTLSGPSSAAIDESSIEALASVSLQGLATQRAGAERMVLAQPYNALKAGDHGRDGALGPQEGIAVEPGEPVETASTVTEETASEKLGDGEVDQGLNPNNGPLQRVRVDSGGQALSTNQGVLISDNQNSLKAGLRGPTLLEDFVMREKVSHFDHERIPERVVHARGSGAHGYFECTDDITDLTRAAPFAEVGKETPVFVRFSTVVGERGSMDTARDTRGFAVKFYTDEGNWDLVGNNIPVFFIQDAMKFPDVVHAVKPEPHHQMPQASSAHDTFWDFISLSPETTHHTMWNMSDRGIPRSYRTMQGFGVHTFRLVNRQNEAVFVKFHWSPVAGTHSLVWDEAVKIGGADPDFHRRDLWESIEGGNYPQWDLQLQVFSEEEAEGYSFDVLDATKLVPEELVPLRTVGRMTLNRNPDNFFAETEQVAFCTSNVVPGIDFSNDPLLQGRNFSYLDTQITRLGGPNHHEIPINASVAQVHNNQRDGFHRQAIARGRVNYEPNSLAGGCPFQAGLRGFASFPAMHAPPDKLRGKPEKFSDHYTQARLFYRSQTRIEQQHIIAAFRFELGRVQTQAIRERMVASLVNVDAELASMVAAGLGMACPAALPRAMEREVVPEIEASPSLSLMARPGDGGVAGRRVALLIADGVEADSLKLIRAALVAADAAPRLVGSRLGRYVAADASELHAEVALEAAPSVLWDAVVVPDGPSAQAALAANAQAIDFIKEQYRHCKPMLVLGSGGTLLEVAGIPGALPDGRFDPGLVISSGAGGDVLADDERGNVRTAASEDVASRFLAALAAHRHFERETDPPAL